MEYPKIINLLGNAPNQPNKFRIKNWLAINDDARGTYNTNSQSKFKTSMLKSSLCDFSDAYILVNGTISGNIEATADNINKNVIFKTYVPFTDCISQTNNIKLNNAKDIDIVMPIYRLTEYIDNYLKTSGSLWKYYRDEPSLNNNDNTVDFTGASHNSNSVNYKQKITRKGNYDSEKEKVKIMVLLKYLSNFGGILEMALLNCETNFKIKTKDYMFILLSKSFPDILYHQCY